MLQHALLDQVVDVRAAPGRGPATRCRLRQFRDAGGRPVVVVTQLAENEGPSVTNAAEHIWRAVARRLDTTEFTLIEHYGAESFAVPDEDAMGFDIVILTPAGQPRWEPIGAARLRSLIGPRELGRGERAG